MVKRVDNSVYMTIRAAIDGSFVGGLREFGLAEDGVAYALDEHNESMVSEEMIARVEEAKAAIIAGEIVVPRK